MHDYNVSTTATTTSSSSLEFTVNFDFASSTRKDDRATGRGGSKACHDQESRGTSGKGC